MLTFPVAETESDRFTEGPTAERYEALIRVAAAVRAQREPRKLFGIFVHELGQVLQFDAIAQFDERSNKVDWHLGSGCHKSDPATSEADNEQTLAAWVYRTQEAVALAALDTDPRFPGTIAKMQQAGLRSALAFPLTTAHRRLGSLVIASVHRDAWFPEDVRFCTLVVNQIALAMDDAINFQASRRAQERLELLLDLTNRVVSKLNLRDVLREISANIRRVMQCDGVAISLPGPPGPDEKRLRL